MSPKSRSESYNSAAAKTETSKSTTNAGDSDITTPAEHEDENGKRSSDVSHVDLVDTARESSQTAPKKLRYNEDNPLRIALEEIDNEDEGVEDTYSALYSRNTAISIIADAEDVLAFSILPIEEELDVSSDEDTPGYVQQSELEETTDFFGNFGDVPDMDQLSLDVSEEVPVEPKKPQVVQSVQDVGSFVCPLTGSVMKVKKEPKPAKEEDVVSQKVAQQEDSGKGAKSKQPKSSKKKEEQQKVAGKPATTSKTEDEETDQDNLLDIMEIESVDITIFSDQEDKPKDKAEEDEDLTLGQFLEFEAKAPTVTIEEIDYEAQIREEMARILQMQTNEFLEYLINRVVEKVEYIDPKVVLRENLDKRKLMRELQEKAAMLEVERRGKQFLNRKCVEYFRRKRSFRPITDENPKTLHVEYEKYQEAVLNLDKWLIKEEEAKTIYRMNLQAAQEQLAIEDARIEEQISNLENSIRKTLKRENFDNLQKTVEYTLDKMEEVRTEISKVRIQLIEKQHNMATLWEQQRKLEDLGNGLSMRDFETIQTETQALGKKIEERNNDLNKQHNRCQGDIHRMAHLRDKQQMLQHAITVQRECMDQLQDDKQSLRERLFQLKIQRNSLRKVLRDLSFQSGLLDKPVLMKDYDATNEYSVHLRENVENCQAAIKSLLQKIEIVEKNYL